MLGYSWWGFLPLYLSLVPTQDAAELLAHRIVWCWLFLMLLLGVRGRLGEVPAMLRNKRLLLPLLLSTAFISVNWFVYVYAVINDQVLQASMGYFIVPLINVALGFFVLKERLRPLQLVSLAVAALGVLVQAAVAGVVPWLGLAVALAFGFYGLVRKIISAGPIVGLTVETLLLTPLAAAYLFSLFSGGAGLFLRSAVGMDLLLIGAGIATAVPLVAFAAAVHRLNYATIGFLQYLAPTLQFLVAVLLLGEPFGWAELLSFLLIWIALAAFSTDGWRAYRQGKHAASAAAPDPNTPATAGM